MSTTTNWAKPADLSAVELVFPANVDHLLPAAPPEMRRNWHRDPWCKQAETWFFRGVDRAKSTIKPKKGIDTDKAFRHLQACLGSWQPKHEDKIAGVGYLMSLWFDKLELVGAK
jgi:hypothetical protein